ncbi:hypothetical protein [Haloglycomyces albus]|uniref:hypothetical protein n=1 Tax=Haloglycomyces albus TaxID=526067 RepID=UPI00046D8C27|nr:hypothetical protein [Haloglycomyces albus]
MMTIDARESFTSAAARPADVDVSEACVLGRFGDDSRPMVAVCPPSERPHVVLVYAEFPHRIPQLICTLKVTDDDVDSTWHSTCELTGPVIRQWVEYEAFRLLCRAMERAAHW